MLKSLLSSLALVLFLTPQALAFSIPLQGDETVELAEQAPIEANIRANANVEVGRNIIFDASETINNLGDEELSYEWFFGDGNRQQGVEVVHSYNKPGEYEVNLVVRANSGPQASVVQDVFVYENSFALISNIASAQDRVSSFVSGARNDFVLIDLVESYNAQSDFLEEEELRSVISENISSLDQSSTIMIWTRGSSGLTVLSQIQKNLSQTDFFQNKEIIFISDENFGSLTNIARGVFQAIHPKQVILTRPEAIWVLPEVSNTEEFVSVLEDRGIQYEGIDDQLKIRPWNLMSHFVNVMINKGIPTNTIRLVLMLPVIVTVVAFMKQVVGLATLGVYTPSILALSFIALDLSFGLLILVSILFIGTLTRIYLRRYRLLYIPRMAIVLTIVSITILFLLFLAAALNVQNVAGIAVFPMLIMSTMVEKFVSIQSGKGLRSALTLVGESVAVAILCYFVAEWGFLKVVVLGHPEVIFLFLLINIFLARWAGLRIVEYFRFREIFRHAEE